MAISRTFLLAIALLSGCYSVPTSLAVLGPTGVIVEAENYGYGATVLLEPEEGCPTLAAEVTLNGLELPAYSQGRSVITGPVYAPGTACEPPSYALSGYTNPSIDGLTLTVADDSDTWTVADSLSLDWIVLDERTLYPAEATVYLDLDRDMDVTNVVVSGGTEMEGGTATITVDDDGVYAVVLNPRWHGETTLVLDAYGTYEAEHCEGFASCTMRTTASGTVTVQVR